jgi:hypothetical protein
MGCFLYLSPLGNDKNPALIKEAFEIMNKRNKNKAISRIENAEARDIPFYEGLGYECREKFGEYLCSRINLARLKGDKFKSKRSAFNYFIKHYKFEYSPFSLKHKNDCLKLYNRWMESRRIKNQDTIYRAMLTDGRACLTVLLDNYADLDFIGRWIKIDNQIKAFTLGFRLNQDTFCILYEITDLSVKGLSQFIFRQFSRELKDYRYINIMDDSGLENLKKVKLSYHPYKVIPAYIVTRKN